MAGGSGAAHRPRPRGSGRTRRRALSAWRRRLGARLLQTLAATFAAATFAFCCLQLAPGDPLTALGEGVPPAVRAQLRAIYGVDAPLGTQYVRWLSALLQGDFGWSISRQRPALDVVLDAVPYSLLVVIPGVLLAFALSALIGAWQGIRADTVGDRVISLAMFVLYALPDFTVALLLLLLFSVVWPVLPSGGVVSDLHEYLSPTRQLLDRLRHLLLPTLVVALVDTVVLTRVQRQSMREVLEQPFVRTARAAGLPPRLVHLQAWRASLSPVLTVFGILLPFNMLGIVFVEQVFAWPGLGRTLLDAITARDYQLVAACVVAQGVIIGASALLVDAWRAAADPRVVAAEPTPSSHMGRA